MSPEQAATDFLRSRPALMSAFNGQIHYGEAPEGIEEPYIIVYPVITGRMKNVGAYFPTLQASVYHTDKFGVIAAAEQLVNETDGYRGILSGSTHTDSFHSERLKPLPNGDGTWMCPVDMKFSYLEG